MKCINKFISEFHGDSVEVFTQRCCYWFAYILAERFGGRIKYDPINGHFATQVGGSIYDIQGEIEDPRMWIDWETYNDELHKSRITRDCVNKI